MTFIARTLTATTLAAIAVAAAAPAVAAGKLPGPRYQVTYQPRSNTYCIRDLQEAPLTGTRLPSTDCKTEQAWAAEGVILARKS